MKKGYILLLLTVLSNALFSQVLTNSGRYDKLMKSSARRQTGGIIFLAGGAALAGGGLLLIKDGVNQQDSYDNTNGIGLSKGENEQVLGVILTGVGIGCMGTSIPFFIGAHKARRKAMRISLKTENASLLYKTNLLRRSYTALAFSIPLGR